MEPWTLKKWTLDFHSTKDIFFCFSGPLVGMPISHMTLFTNDLCVAVSLADVPLRVPLYIFYLFLTSPHITGLQALSVSGKLLSAGQPASHSSNWWLCFAFSGRSDLRAAYTSAVSTQEVWTAAGLIYFHENVLLFHLSQRGGSLITSAAAHPISRKKHLNVDSWRCWLAGSEMKENPSKLWSDPEESRPFYEGFKAEQQTWTYQQLQQEGGDGNGFMLNLRVQVCDDLETEKIWC